MKSRGDGRSRIKKRDTRKKWRDEERRARQAAESVVNGCVRCTLFPSPMSLASVISETSACERDGGIEGEREKECTTRERWYVHACARTLSTLSRVSSIYFERRQEFLAFARGR